jgi:hypothetical protein
MSDPMKTKLRKKAKKAQRRAVEKALEANSHHAARRAPRTVSSEKQTFGQFVKK